jgi:hypothetical protein
MCPDRRKPQRHHLIRHLPHLPHPLHLLLLAAILAPLPSSSQDPPAPAPPATSTPPPRPALFPEFDHSAIVSRLYPDPFSRSLDLESKLALTGLAKVQDTWIATVADRETKEASTISGAPNAEGLMLFEVTGDPSDLSSIRALVGTAGSRPSPITYDPEIAALVPPIGAPRPVPREQLRSRSSEIVRNLALLDPQQREAMFRRVDQFQRDNPNSNPDQVRDFLRDQLNRTLDGRR